MRPFELTVTSCYYTWVNQVPWICLLRGVCENIPDAHGRWQVSHYGRSGSWGVALRLLSQWRVCQNVAVTSLLMGRKAGCSQVPGSLCQTPLGSQHPWTSSGASTTWELSFLKACRVFCFIASKVRLFLSVQRKSLTVFSSPVLRSRLLLRGCFT